MGKISTNDNKTYLLQKGSIYATPATVGVYTNLNDLKKALLMLAEPVRNRLQHIPAYFPCDDEVWGGEDYLSCDKNCTECVYYNSPAKHEKDVEEAIHNLHYPDENIYVTVMSVNEQPVATCFNDGYDDETIIQPVSSVTYHLFPVEAVTLGFIPANDIHYVSELYGKEIFNLFSGPLSDLEKKMEKTK